MTMTTPGVAPEPTKFEACRPGSLVEFSGMDFPAPATGTVIQLLPEFGPTSIPALLVHFEGEADDRLIVATGRNRVSIIRDAAKFSAAAPEEAVAAKLLPEDVVAVRFTGGSSIATKMIQWTAGKTSLSYMAEQGDIAEHMIIRTLGQDAVVSIGDWVVQHGDDSFEAFTAERFAKTYDVDPRAMGLGAL